jgi:hypothetical protein
MKRAETQNSKIEDPDNDPSDNIPAPLPDLTLVNRHTVSYTT